MLGAWLLAACNVPTVGGPLVFTRDGAAAPGPDGGGSAGDAGAPTALVGDPCAVDSDCASGNCANGTWCTRACAADAECGDNSAGLAGVCAMASTGQVACYPGCATGADCVAYPGTQC
ncbi:MAG: hypothetical protein JOZ69_17365, partial [Myxococcales bacterium]|nr:hypothetical protein [Myxococcales bacterium]